ncbi:MAG: ECF-type sigma factor [Acidobacteriota bacterium]
MVTHGVTDLLVKLSGGDQAVVDKLLSLIYDELKRLAAAYLRRERSDHTLQPRALVNEAYIKLVDIIEVSWQNKARFIGVAPNQMQRILVDNARQLNAQKRGGEYCRRERLHIPLPFLRGLSPVRSDTSRAAFRSFGRRDRRGAKILLRSGTVVKRLFDKTAGVVEVREQFEDFGVQKVVPVGPFTQKAIAGI